MLLYLELSFSSSTAEVKVYYLEFRDTKTCAYPFDCNNAASLQSIFVNNRSGVG